MKHLTVFWEPGDLVEHPQHPDWGIGQVQSVVDTKVTVNFREVGKLVIDATFVELVTAIQNEQR
ncbi:MAG: DUF3553 domain-containing protein [Paracoccaceae bacterium]|jgi:transcription elongation factor GreA-like protein|tara:strand:+ start:91 stop:282 length:192 start_codon:yes stop_codon:yes gene_type:complete